MGPVCVLGAVVVLPYAVLITGDKHDRYGALYSWERDSVKDHGPFCY